MHGSGAPHRCGAVLVAAVILTACGGGRASPASTASAPSTVTPVSTKAAESPVSTPASVVCPLATAGASIAPAEPDQWPGLNPPPGLSAAVETEFAELIEAIGNPDTGSRSPAWEEFEGALTVGDPAPIRASAETVLKHLEAACAAVAPYFDRPGAGAWAIDVRGLYDGLAAAVVMLRDATIADDRAGVDAGRARMQTTLLDHFYQSFKMSNPSAYRVDLRDRQWSATASHVRWMMNEVWGAFDGDPATAWLTGEVAPPQWIEVDFGMEAAVTGIRLLTYQEIAGATDHRVTVRTATGKETEFARFTGDTRDEEWLEFTAPAPIENVRYVRVMTLATSSMIGWREVEVTVAAGSVAGPCPASTTAITDVVLTKAEPSTGASDPALAVDGNEATGWDPGPIRGVDGARGWIRVWFASQVRISAVRLLLGPGSAGATYHVVLFPPGEFGTGLGDIESVPAGGGWVSLAGPNPCLPFESVYIFVKSEEPAGAIRELRVLGTEAP